MYRARILILEDDLQTLSLILHLLSQIDVIDISVVVLTEYVLVEKFVNASDEDYDLILLDRDCFLGGSFHVLDIERFGGDKIISISSVPEWNEEAKKRGVKKVVLKDYKYLDNFYEELGKKIREYFKII